MAGYRWYSLEEPEDSYDNISCGDCSCQKRACLACNAADNMERYWNQMAARLPVIEFIIRAAMNKPGAGYKHFTETSYEEFLVNVQ